MRASIARTVTERAQSPFALATTARLDGRKFRDPQMTADGKVRASVELRSLETLWVNTGTLCNLSCTNCYIESSPVNDRLAWFTTESLLRLLDEDAATDLRMIGFTGGEPFMNPDIIGLLDIALARGHDVLVLTNAMRPMQHHEQALRNLNERYSAALTLRVSLDHFSDVVHDAERGSGAWLRAIEGIGWLVANNFNVTIAGRMPTGQTEAEIRYGFRELFDRMDFGPQLSDPKRLLLFAEMDESADVPEISEDCWDILGKQPNQLMCANSRMVVQRKGAAQPSVIACTLLPDSAEFDLGPTLQSANRSVALNHPHCARFCVLGGSSCGGS